MRRIRNRHLLSALIAVCALAAARGAADWSDNFEAAEIGKAPAGFMVLDGDFAIRKFDGHKCLELAGDPIGSFGALFGPGEFAAVDIKARIWAAATGKRYPVFGIGATDAGGYKLFLDPAQNRLVLRKGDDEKASVKAAWSSGTWTWFRLRAEPGQKSAWLIRGRIWRDGSPEPAKWMLSAGDTDRPSPGRASIWGEAFSERPIRFSNLSVTAVQ